MNESSREVADNPRRVSAQALREYIASAGHVGGIAEPDLTMFVDGILEADLRGIDTHGVARVPAYVRGMLRGGINPRPIIRPITERKAIAVLDGDNGLGLIVGQHAMDRAIELATVCGVGVVAVRNSNHTGMLAQHALRAAYRGMIGYFVNNSPPVMAPWGGVDAKLGNNPFAYAFPTASELPLVIDMACSAVARGKVRRAALENERIPSTWAITKSGLPTEDAHEAMSGTVLPMGGPKGYALAVVNELLAGALPGALLSFQVSTTFVREGASAFDSWSIGHLAVALDVESFGSLATFKEAVRTLERELKESGLASGTTEILLPGERGWRERQKRLKHGVPFPSVVLSELNSAAQEFGIPALP